jgi:uncharacterized damage-inducible protein DinB
VLGATQLVPRRTTEKGTPGGENIWNSDLPVDSDARIFPASFSPPDNQNQTSNSWLEDFMQETPEQYIKRILGFVEGKDPLRVQRETPKKLQTLVKPLSKNQLMQRPEPGKWSVGEILAHLADAELVGGWRMRLILGNNGVSLQPFDQDVWADTFAYARRDPAASLETFRVLRESNLAMLKALPKNLWENYGMHQERGKETITHIVRMFAGHDLNHLGQIEKIRKGGSKRAA